MTHKQKKFIELYVVLNDAAQAAVGAGYSPKTAKRTGALNVQKLAPLIQERRRQLEEGRAPEQREPMSVADKEEILIFLSQVLRENENAGIRERMRAAELLGKVGGMFSGKKDGLSENPVLITGENELDL